MITKHCITICCLFLLVGLISCASNDTKVLKKVALVDSFLRQYAFKTDSIKKCSLQEIFTIKRKVALETNDSCFLTNIDKLFIAEDSLIIILSKKQAAIFFFDMEGHYLRKIQNFGDGPQQYVSLTDATYDSFFKNLLILDIRSRSVVEYNLKGEFIRKRIIPNPEDIGDAFNYFNGNYIFSRNNDDISKYSGQVAILDTGNFNIKNYGIDIIKEFRNHTFITQHQIDNYKDSVFYIPFLSDSIYYISEEKIMPYLAFSYDNKNPIVKELGKRETEEEENTAILNKLFMDNGVWGFCNLFILDNHIFLSFMFNKKVIYLVYNKANKTANMFRPQYEAKEIFLAPLSKWQNLLISQMVVTSPKSTYEANPILIFYSIN